MDKLTLTTRVSEPGDLAEVDALLARSYPRLLKHDYPPSVLVTALPRIARAQPALLGCGTYFLAQTSEGVIVGAGGWTRDRTAPQILGHVRHVVSDDRFPRQGIGAAILDKILVTARAAGISQLECWSTRTAEQFYHAQGFETQGPIDVPLQPGIVFPSIRMMRTI